MERRSGLRDLIDRDFVSTEQISMRSTTTILTGIGLAVILITLYLIWSPEMGMAGKIIITLILGVSLALILYGLFSMFNALRKVRLP